MDLGHHDIAKVSILMFGKYAHCGIRFTDRKGKKIGEAIWQNFRENEPNAFWVTQKIPEGKYLAGFHGKVHKTRGNILQIGLITGPIARS